MSLPALLLMALLTGCADPYEDAKKVDTIEAYESFIKENADHARVGQAKARLAELELEEVRKIGTLEAYNEFITKFKKGKAHDTAMGERKPMLLAWAESTDTAEAWQLVVDDYGTTDRKLMLKARRRLTAASNRAFVGIGELTQSKVNAAGDPKGPLDALQLSAPVTNNGTKPALQMTVSAHFTKDDGTLVTAREWPVVAKRLPEALPMPPGFDTPMAPGETRTWTFKAMDIPEGWTKVTLQLADVRWVGEKAANAAEKGGGDKDADGKDADGKDGAAPADAGAEKKAPATP